MEEKNLHVRIVPMTADHLDEVAELERICFSTPWSRNMLAEELDNYLSAFLVALDDNDKVVGYAGLQAVLDEVQRVFAGLPVILGGDLNTNTFDGRDKDYIRHLADHPAELADNIVKIDSSEPLLTACGDAGYAWRTASGDGRLTRRKPVGEGNFLAMRLDWIIPRGFTAKDSRVISTVTADIDFAKEGGALARFAEPELSDHNVVWASLQLHK